VDPLLKGACKTDPSQVHHFLLALLNMRSFSPAQGTLMGADLHERAAEAGDGAAEVEEKLYGQKHIHMNIDLEPARTQINKDFEF
jgi:hypothetical protein